MKKGLIIILFKCLCYFSICQDIHFTQFYNNPIYLNPSYTGFNIDSRYIINYRNQWPSLSANYRTFSISYDKFFYKYNSGIGIIIMNDIAGSMNFGNRNVGFNYSYHVKVDYQWRLSIGIRGLYGYRTLNFEKLIFPDQLQRMSNYSLQPKLPEKDSYFNLASGISFNTFSKSIGFSIEHINKSENSFKHDNYYIPLKSSLHFAYAFFTKKAGSGKKEDIPVILLINQLTHQSKFYKNEIGIIYKNPFYSIGVIYRGIPFKKSYANYIINDAIAIYCSYIYKTLEIAYSYDITISTLSIESGGAHEVSLIYKFYNLQKEKKFKAKVLPCSKF
ncbi:MAG: PorP/SprF family type IX secretion system membrane protein [Bacteroidales bacterium]|nr:PorP/SprF family type IX secretion system membrane protein [Bacteroidales bacterium]